MTEPQRGCGTRQEGGLYACCPISRYGMPIEYFLIDPTIPWNGKQLRGPMLVESKKDPDVLNVVIGVGKEYYPFVPDFVEEVRAMGISKRFPRDFPIERLTPGRSRMIMLHLRAIPGFKYKAVNLGPCPRRIRNNGHKCIMDLWTLSALKSMEKHKVWQTSLNTVVTTPSVKYYINIPEYPGINDTKRHITYHAGLFASFPLNHFEFVTKKKTMPRALKDRIKKSGYGLKVCKE